MTNYDDRGARISARRISSRHRAEQNARPLAGRPAAVTEHPHLPGLGYPERCQAPHWGGRPVHGGSTPPIRRWPGSLSGMTTGWDALRRHAPAAADSLDAVVATMWSDAAEAGLTDLVASCGGAAADLLHLDSLDHLAVPGRHPGIPTADDEGVSAFAAQSCLDVASVTPEQRAAFLAAAGDRAGTLAASLWVGEFVPRTRAALDALFGSGPWPAPAAAPVPGGVWAALNGLIRTVPTLDALDPVTSELVRLRGARQHDCRLCRSLRNRTALRAGATEVEFAAVDHYEHSDLTPLAQAALKFTDAMIWTPGRIDPAAVTTLAAAATPAQQVELVLDITRNALNKIAVGLGADAAHVEEGVELYDVAPDGSLLYGLDPD